MKDALLLCAQKGVPVYFYNRVGREKSAGWRYAESAERRIAFGLDFPMMYAEPEKYRDDLKEIFADRYSDEYVEAIGKIPQVVKVGDMFCHEDCKSEYVNVVSLAASRSNLPVPYMSMGGAAHSGMLWRIRIHYRARFRNYLLKGG